MNPTSHAAMSGGWAVTGRKAQRGWCGPEPSAARRLHGPPLSARKGLALTARGPQAPSTIGREADKKSRKKKMHPQEGQYSAADTLAAGPGTECGDETG
jgi:hypothetical protein